MPSEMSKSENIQTPDIPSSVTSSSKKRAKNSKQKDVSITPEILYTCDYKQSDFLSMWYGAKVLLLQYCYSPIDKFFIIYLYFLHLQIAKMNKKSVEKESEVTAEKIQMALDIQNGLINSSSKEGAEAHDLLSKLEEISQKVIEDNSMRLYSLLRFNLSNFVPYYLILSHFISFYLILSHFISFY